MNCCLSMFFQKAIVKGERGEGSMRGGVGLGGEGGTFLWGGSRGRSRGGRPRPCRLVPQAEGGA